jgi:hypothetical protein
LSDIGLCDFWLFGIGMLKGVLKNREFNSGDKIKEAIMTVWDELTFDEGQNVFQNWMNCLACVIENGDEYITEMIPSYAVNLKLEGVPGTLFTSCMSSIHAPRKDTCMMLSGSELSSSPPFDWHDIYKCS